MSKMTERKLRLFNRKLEALAELNRESYTFYTYFPDHYWAWTKNDGPDLLSEKDNRIWEQILTFQQKRTAMVNELMALNATLGLDHQRHYLCCHGLDCYSSIMSV